VPKIRPEISTRADVERWFGDPQTVSTTGSGHSRWTYLYEERTTRDTRTITKIWRSIASVFGGRIFVPPVDVAYENVSRHRLVVWFDSSGTVADYTYARTDLPKKRIY
jgi:outer membrane protein assembly factor BamE (lipoprotein component of BamABCDE complex)